MLVSKFLTCSLIAISVAIVAQPSLASDEVVGNRQKAKKDDGWQVVMTPGQKKEQARERKQEKKQQARAEAREQRKAIKEQAKKNAQKPQQPKPVEQIKAQPPVKEPEALKPKLVVAEEKKPEQKAAQKPQQPKSVEQIKTQPPVKGPEEKKSEQKAAQKPAQTKSVEQVKAQPLVKKSEAPKAKQIAAEEKKTEKKPTVRKDDRGWQEVPIRSGRKPQETQQVVKEKKTPDPKALEAAEKRAQREKDWTEIKEDLLARAAKKEIPGFVQEVEQLLERLKKQFKYGPIKRAFPDYLTLLKYGPKQTIEAQIMLFRSVCTANNAFSPDGERSNLIGDLLYTLREKDRADVASRLMGVILTGGLEGLNREYVKEFKKFDGDVAIEVLELVFDRKQTKLIQSDTFAEAFNELMAFLLIERGVARTTKEAQAYFGQIKGLAKHSSAKDLDMTGYDDPKAAWNFRLQAEGIEMTPMIFNAAQQTFDDHIRQERAFRDYAFGPVERVREPSFFLILKLCGLEKEKFHNAYFQNAYDVKKYVEDFSSDRTSEEFVAALTFMVNNREWVKNDNHFRYCHSAPEICSMLLQVRKLGLDQTHWGTVLSDIVRLSDISNMKERIRKRVEAMSRLPENIRKKIAQGFWKIFVAEQELAGRNGEDYGWHGERSNENIYTKALLELVYTFPEQDEVRAFQCVREILKGINQQTHHSLAPNRPIIDKLARGLLSVEAANKLRFLEAVAAYLKGKPERLERVSNFLAFFPYLENDTEHGWLENLVDTSQGRGVTTAINLMDWYLRCDNKTQETVHDFWKSELVKEVPNKPLAKFILETRRKLPDSLQDLIPVAALKERKEAMERMHSDERDIARPAAVHVVQEYRYYGVIDRDNDDVYQYAVYIIAKTEDSKDPLNPYNVLKHHMTVAEKEKVDYQAIRTPAVAPIEGGKRYYAEGDVFKGIRVNQVTFSQLPVHSKTYLRVMRDRLLLKNQPKINKYIRRALEGGLLEYWLSVTGAPQALVPPVNAKLIAIVAHLQGFPDDEVDKWGLTRQEQMFSTFMRYAQACETNKTEVVNKFYVSLPPNARLPQMKCVGDRKEDYLRQVFEEPFLDMLETLLACEGPFLRALSGLEPGQVLPNASHVEMFVKNLIMVDVPLYKKLERDVNTKRCVPLMLLKYTRAAVLELMFKFFTVEDLAKVAHDAIHRAMLDPKSPMIMRVQKFMEKRGAHAQLEYDEKTQKTTMPIAAVYELLHLLGFFKVEK